jgi:hypothetical protein
MLKFFSILIFTAANLTAIARGQATPIWEPPSIGVPFIPETEHPSGAQELVSEIAIGSFNVVLEKTLLEQVGTHFRAFTGHSGDAGESLDWVCLHGQNRIGQWILWIESGEIHGQTVGGFLLLQRTANDKLDSHCKSVENARISLPIPLSLGMSRAQVVAALGPPTSQSGSHLFYYHLNPEAGDAAETLTRVSTLYIRLNGRNEIDALQVWRTTSS